MADEGAPAWGDFTLNLNIPEEDLPVNGTLTLELFELSPEDGTTKLNTLIVKLESFS
jgi:hypothetical protein